MASDAEQAAYVQRLLDGQAVQLAAYKASTQAAIDNLRQSWSEGYEQKLADHRAWLKSLYGDADEPAPTDVVRGQVAGASAAGPAPAPGPGGPGREQPNQLAAELAEVERLKQLPMSAWAEERQRLIRASTSARGLFD